MMKIRPGPNQQKALLLLATGVALTLTTSPLRSWRLIKGARREWRAINQRALRYAISQLYRSRLIRERRLPDGTVEMILTDVGKERVLRHNPETMAIQKPSRWDKKWRIALFDIPEKQKKLRDAFRFHLKRLGFHEFQQSVFVHPFDCREQLEFLVEFYNARKYVRFIVAESLDNDLHIRTHFGLPT